MATRLKRPVTREVVVKDDWQARGTYNVTLSPPSLIIFREKKKKKAYTATLRSVLSFVVQQQLLYDYREAMKEYKEKKKLGIKRIRKPVKRFLL